MTPYYDADGVTIWHADCRDVDAWTTADVVVTDPPYGIGWTRGANPLVYSKAHTGIAGDESTRTRDEALARVPNTPAVVFGSFYAPYPDRVRQVLVWRKPLDAGVVGSTTGHRRDAEPIFLLDPWPIATVRWSSVLMSARASIKSVTVETGHPHTKPVDLMQTILGRSPAGMVADPFAGSGSTLVAARLLGRQAIGVEVDERYCEIAANRLAQGVLDLGGTA